METARLTIGLAWALPVGVALEAAVWIVPLPLHTAAARRLDEFVVGTWIFLLIWLVWSAALAAVTAYLVHDGRRPGVAWLTAQVLLLVVLVVGAVPPALSGLRTGPIETLTTGFAFLILPVAAIVVSGFQGIVLFLRA